MRWPEWTTQPKWSGPAPAPQDIACIMYTSGTSGPSKGVLMPHAHCALYGVGTIRAAQLTDQELEILSHEPMLSLQFVEIDAEPAAA